MDPDEGHKRYLIELTLRSRAQRPAALLVARMNEMHESLMKVS
jgi:hypothetical protein